MAEYREIYPANLLKETNDTLLLLFPPFDVRAKRWAKKTTRRVGFDLESAPMVASRYLGHYQHWQDRLAILKDALETSRPRQFKQYWYDRRDVALWYKFWYALLALTLTAIFSLIQAITGIMQVYSSFNSDDQKTS